MSIAKSHAGMPVTLEAARELLDLYYMYVDQVEADIMDEARFGKDPSHLLEHINRMRTLMGLGWMRRMLVPPPMKPESAGTAALTSSKSSTSILLLRGELVLVPAAGQVAAALDVPHVLLLIGKSGCVRCTDLAVAAAGWSSEDRRCVLLHLDDEAGRKPLASTPSCTPRPASSGGAA